MNLKNYNCLKKNVYLHNDYSLIPLREDDLQLIRKWRNEQIQFLRQENLLTEKDQKLYFKNTVLPSFIELNPKIILFSFIKNSKLIGYGGFVNIDWTTGLTEISFLIETNRSKNETYAEDFASFLHLVKIIGCYELKFKEIYTETYNIRPIHIGILEKNSFQFKKILDYDKIINGKSVNVLFHSYICNK